MSIKEKFAPLFETITLNSGHCLDSRFSLAPMVIDGSSAEGYVQQDDLDFFDRRANTASLKISGATMVAPYSNAFGYGLGNIDDSYTEGLSLLAQSMKKGNAKAILQIYHSGREASVSYEKEGIAYGPSSKQFSFLSYPVTGMTATQVEETIEAFAQATKRAIDAGFDGVEIHGANHYLIQQFFSTLSNDRSDQWGGDLKKRAHFPLAIVKAVKESVAKYTSKPFIIGYRLSPEEIHDESIGYTFDDSLYLIDKVADLGVDYIHISSFGPSGYKKKAQLGQFEGQIMNNVVKEKLNNRAALMVVGDITSPEKALDALNYGDIIALASAAVVEPDFKDKIEQRREEGISLDITRRVDDLKLPKNFGLVASVLRFNQSIPPVSIDLLKDRNNTLA